MKIMQDIELFGLTLAAWVYAPIFYFLWVTLGVALKKIIFASLHRVAGKTRTQIDDILVHALDLPLFLIIFVSGVVVLERIAPVQGDAELTRYLIASLKVTTVIAMVIFFDRLSRGIIRGYAQNVELLKASGGIIQGLVRFSVIGLGALIILDGAGVSITPIIASLGIGSLAVALALQPTLENFFSGMQIVIDRPIQQGQFIKLASGEEGYVHRVGWRSTWIRQLPNNMVVIPNKELVSSRIINYYYPEQELAVLVQVGVHYDSDLEQVERVTIEVGEEVMKGISGGVPEFKPFIRYHTFDSSSINFTVILRAREFVDNYLVKHEFIKNLHKRYRKEGIVIPYPIRAINTTQEKASFPLPK
jgi:small-conductance mechanosensitive channel